MNREEELLELIKAQEADMARGNRIPPDGMIHGYDPDIQTKTRVYCSIHGREDMRPEGLSHRCRVCERERSRRRYATSPAYRAFQSAYQREYRKKWKERMNGV